MENTVYRSAYKKYVFSSLRTYRLSIKDDAQFQAYCHGWDPI